MKINDIQSESWKDAAKTAKKESVAEAMRPVPVDDKGNRIPDRMPNNAPKRPFGQPGDAKSSSQGVVTYTPTGIVHRSNHGDVTPRPRAVPEGSQHVDSLVTDALKIMRGSETSDAVAALKTVLGDREYNSRRGYYNFYVRQLLDMSGQQGMTEADMTRRGFLKGAGAAAVAGAAGGANATDFTTIPNNNVPFDRAKERLQTRFIVDDVLVLYYFLKKYKPNDPLIKEIQAEIKTFLQKHPENKDNVNRSWATTDNTFTQFQNENPRGYERRMQEVFTNARGIINQFKNLSEFNESVDQGVAEGSGGNWYIRVNGKILNDTKFKPVIFSSKDEARSHAMKLADKKRIPLSQMKLTKSWMDAPEQGVAEGVKGPAKKPNGEPTRKTLALRKWNC